MSQDFDFTGRSALITGAASGIGAACAAWLTTAGGPDHPAYWVLGYLSSPGLAALQRRPARPRPEILSRAFGAWVRELRQRKNLTQTDVAQAPAQRTDERRGGLIARQIFGYDLTRSSVPAAKGSDR